MTAAESAAILEGMAADDRTALLEELPREHADRLLALLSPGRAGGRRVAPAVQPRQRRPADDAGLRRRQEGLDGQARPRPRPDPRQGQRDARTSSTWSTTSTGSSTTSASGPSCSPRSTSTSATVLDGQFIALKATDDKKAAVDVFRKYDRTVLPVVDAAGRWSGSSRSTTCSTWPRRRRPARSRSSAASRRSTRPYVEHAAAGDGPEAGVVAGDPLPRRDADGDGDGPLRGRDRQVPGAGAVPAADHLQRRQLRARRPRR